MLTDCAVDSSAAPICSAADMNRLLKISSITGSAAVPTPASAGASTRSTSRCPVSAIAARQPSSTTVVALASAMIAGPVTAAPAGMRSRSNNGASRHSPPDHSRTVSASTPASLPRPLATSASTVRSVCSVSPVASTETASTMRRRSRRKEYVRRWIASNAATIASGSASSTASALSVPS